MTLRVAVGRYWEEVGQHHAASLTTLTNLERLRDYFGEDKRLDEISDDDIAKLVAWRRAQTVKGRRKIADPAQKGKTIPAPLISPATVNRSTVEVLQKLFNRARNFWSRSFPREPKWRQHLLPETTERVREVRAGEEDALEDAIRADYRPLVEFARASGLRMTECLLRKDQVDLIAGRILTIGKGGKPIDHPITSEMRAILMAEMANPTKYVFTYAAARAKREKKGQKGHAKGARLPITPSGLKTLWRRSKRPRGDGPSLPADLRFHDLRHDFATKLLRETRNLKLVQRALHHSKIETTTRYAHVLDEEVAAGMEAASKSRKKSRKRSRTAGGCET
ncbi:tyrosine-type recombinase/integrase [Methylosinus sp. R-45379]|uniref:tyrosine-type recombinase/integrase n=1 Tax=Methylosinus sp. R-45379 TaxID=980563 RepID=UPI000B164793|nr:tyrosine-type recombinase/integrase [Methylosinus sp. R-45379]